MSNSRSPQFRIGNEYETDDIAEDWFWDIQSKSTDITEVFVEIIKNYSIILVIQL